jgi:hypothetical protein
VIEEGGTHEQGSVWSWYSVCGFRGGGVEEVGWGVSKPNRAASYTARLGSGQEAGVGAGPESHGRGVDCFLGIAVGRDVV